MEKSGERGVKLRLRVTAPARGGKKERVVYFALIDTEKIPAVMKKAVPVRVVRQAFFSGLAFERF